MNMCSIKSRAENVGHSIKITTGPTLSEKETLPHIYTDGEAMELAMEILRAIYRNRKETEFSGRIQILFDGILADNSAIFMDNKNAATVITRREIENIREKAESIEKYTQFNNIIGLKKTKDELDELLNGLLDTINDKE